MENLLKETLAKLAESGKSPTDVRFVTVIREAEKGSPVGTWDEFASFADFDYDDGYGGAEINGSLKIVGDDWWLERGEYDGSEWWEFKTIPARPDKPLQLRDDDLKDRW